MSKLLAFVLCLCAITGCEGCGKHGKSLNPTASPTVVEEFEGPFADTTDITFHDLAIAGTREERIYIAFDKLSSTGARTPGLFVTESDRSNWREVGASFFSQQQNARRIILEFTSNEQAGWCVIEHPTVPPTSSIYETLDGGISWTGVFLNVHGSISGIVGTWKHYYIARSELIRWGGTGTSGPFLQEWDGATQQFVPTTLPTLATPALYQMDRSAQALVGPMDGAIYAPTDDPVRRLPWGELLPAQSITLPMGEVILKVGGSNALVTPAIAMGRYGFRTASGYTPYAPMIALPVTGAEKNAFQTWIVSATNEIWFSMDQVSWMHVYAGRYPTFHASGTSTTDVHVAYGRGDYAKMWMLSEGTHLVSIPYRTFPPYK